MTRPLIGNRTELHNFPIIGFAVGTPLLTLEGHKPIEHLRPGDLILAQPDEDQGHHEPEAHEDDHADDPSPWWERN